MRLIGPVLASIRSHLSEAARTELDDYLRKPKRADFCIVQGARSHSSELPDGTKVLLMCHQSKEEHCGIDIDLKTPSTDSKRAHDIQLRETWNGKAAIEMRVGRGLVECRPHEMTGKIVGECVKLPSLLSNIGALPIESFEDHTDEMVIHLSLTA